MKGGKAPTAEQKRFHDWVAEQGCAMTGGPASIHHCVGSTAKHGKIPIGQWWVIPLSYEYHQGPHGIHGDLTIFDDPSDDPRLSRKEIEKEIFITLLFWEDHPVPQNVYNAIMEYTI